MLPIIFDLYIEESINIAKLALKKKEELNKAPNKTTHIPIENNKHENHQKRNFSMWQEIL